MSMDSIKNRGYLSKLPVKGLMKKWTKKWFVLHGTSHEGVVRVEYFDSEDCAVSGIGKRTIPLRDCSEISTATATKLYPYVFQFKSQIGHHVLAADSQPDKDSWMELIKQAIHDDRQRRRRNKTESKVVASPDDETSFSFNTPGGLSYKNRVDSGSYRVTVEENETSLKMNLSGSYSLELSPTTISLTAPSRAKIFSLSYRYLKNYGKQSGQFHFETGKNAPIGEGKLIFVTTCSKEIFGVVHSNIKKLKEKMQQDRPAEKKSEPPPQQQKSPQQKPPQQKPPQQKPQQQKSPQQKSPQQKSPQQIPPQQKPPQQIPPQQKPPQQKRVSIGAGSTSRRNSRQSSEIVDDTIPGTYRMSKNLDEPAQSTILEENTMGDKTEDIPEIVEGKTAEDTPEDPASLYTKVDMSKKSSRKKQEDNTHISGKPEPHTTNTSQPVEAIYADPYEEDLNYGAPPVPDHRSSSVHDPRVSYALVEIEDNAFFDSFDDDDDEGNLNLLSGGTTHPLDLLNFGSGGEPKAPSPPSATNNENMMDFSFDMEAFRPIGDNNPFNGHLAGMGPHANMAEFDLGTLDANFFEKLEAIEVSGQAPPHGWEPTAAGGGSHGNRGEAMNNQDFEKFWSNMDASMQRFK